MSSCGAEGAFSFCPQTPVGTRSTTSESAFTIRPGLAELLYPQCRSAVDHERHAPGDLGHLGASAEALERHIAIETRDSYKHQSARLLQEVRNKLN